MCNQVSAPIVSTQTDSILCTGICRGRIYRAWQSLLLLSHYILFNHSTPVSLPPDIPQKISNILLWCSCLVFHQNKSNRLSFLFSFQTVSILFPGTMRLQGILWMLCLLSSVAVGWKFPGRDIIDLVVRANTDSVSVKATTSTTSPTMCELGGLKESA